MLMPSAGVIGRFFTLSSMHLLVHTKCHNPGSIGWASDGGFTAFLVELVLRLLGKQDHEAEGTNIDPTPLSGKEYHEPEGAPSTETQG
jgi:hypothetical protein